MYNSRTLKDRIFKLKNEGGYKNKGLLAKGLGCSRPMLHLYEKGENEPPNKFLEKLSKLEKKAGIRQSLDDLFNAQAASNKDGSTLNEDFAIYNKGVGSAPEVRFVPLLHWSDAHDFKNSYFSSDRVISRLPTSCDDEKSFAVRLEGDSMEPKFSEGVDLIVSPERIPYSGQYVLMSFTGNSGVLFRRVEISGDEITVIPENERYPVGKYNAADVEWIYPVYEVIHRLMERN